MRSYSSKVATESAGFEVGVAVYAACTKHNLTPAELTEIRGKILIDGVIFEVRIDRQVNEITLGGEQ